jgi:hypothetical protein
MGAQAKNGVAGEVPERSGSRRGIKVARSFNKAALLSSYEWRVSAALIILRQGGLIAGKI